MSAADSAIVREFLHVVTAQAKAAIKGDDNPGAQRSGQSGLLQLSRLHPSSEELVPTRFTLDDVEGMITTAVSDAENGHNVYIEARLVRPGLQGKERGKFADTTAVFALVVDSDNDKGMAWEPTVPVSLTVETSPGNYHYWFFLRQAVSAEVGKQLGERIRKAVGADHDSGNVVQPYRVAGTVNYPNKTKIERGRVTVETRIIAFDPEVLWTPEDIERAFPLPEPEPTPPGADEDNIPADTMQVIRDGVEDGQRSGAFWNVMLVLKRRGFTVDGIVALLEKYPDGIAKKYRGRLRDEVERACAKITIKPADGPGHKRFRLIPFGAIRPLTRPNYLIKGILPRVGLAVVWGPPKCGKSFWTYDAVMHIALDWLYRGRKVQHGTVVFCALEGGDGFARRVEAWRQRYLAADHDHVPFYLIDVPLDLIADHAALIEDINAQVGDDEPPACVVIDTLNRALAGSENKPEDMADFIRAADAIRLAFNCLVVIVHHCGIEGGRPRGHSSLPGADDVQIRVERDSDGTGNTIITTVEHMKDDEAGAVLSSRLEPLNIGPDDDGDEMNSCVIVACDGKAQKPASKDWGKSKTVKLLRRIIMTMLAEQGTELRPWADGPMVRALRVEQVRAEFFKAHYADGETEKARHNAKRMAFRRAIEAAREKRGIVTREIGGVEYIWLGHAADEAQATMVRTASRKPADDPAPTQRSDEGVSVPFMLTAAHKHALHALGYSDEQIREMTPQQGHDILAQRRKLASVLAAWLAAIGASQRHTAEQVIAAADAAVADDDEAGDKLKRALAAVAGPDHLNSNRLEEWLRSISGVEVDHLSLRSDGADEKGAPQWTLKLRVDPDKGSDAD